MSISLFLDSGAYSMHQELFVKKGILNYSESDEFWEYVDKYAEFVKQYIQYLDVYVNVDILRDAGATWKVQKYLEDVHKLNPLPVFHPRDDFKWFKKYLDNYEYIGVGGIGGGITKDHYIPFGDKIFELVCPEPIKLPKWKIHGFGLTSVTLMFRYPFYSVDSASWVHYSAYGHILVPRYDLTKGKYLYEETAQVVTISTRSQAQPKEGRHYSSYSEIEKEHIKDYIEMLGFKVGKSEHKRVNKDYKLQEKEGWYKKGEVVEVAVEEGLCNNTYLRDEFNIAYMIEVQNAIPEWPWPFEGSKSGTKRFGLLKGF